MITWTSLSPRALKAVVEGRITRDDVREAFQRMDALMDGDGKVDLLADVRGQVSIELSAIGEEMRHLSVIGRMLGKMDRVALIADPAWIRAVGRIESHLLPHIDYRVFERGQAEEARAFVMRQDETAPA
ncbi:MAG TPA: STAS/SEC14 domain-containing protein [Allosphingosinicella sp.]|nr:STAS/SEC14 domain-containing protein [Allosphingosinicella sp.]